MKSEIEEAVKRERQACLDIINKHIKHGDLQGNGFDETAQRNGLIIANNLIRERMMEGKRI